MDMATVQSWAKVHGGSSGPRQGQERASLQEGVGREDAPCPEKHGHTGIYAGPVS